MKNLLDLNYEYSVGKLSSLCGCKKFEVVREGGASVTDNPVSAVFCAEIDFNFSEEIYLEYSLIGFDRGKAYRTPAIYLTDENGESVSLIANDDLNTDGRRYAVASSVKPGKYVRISLQLSVDRAKSCELCVYKLYTCKKDELPAALSSLEGKRLDGICSLDISPLFNGSYFPEAEAVKIGGSRGFDKEDVAPLGIPFKVKCEGENAVMPPPPPIENEDIIDNFGVKAKRGLTRPISRHSNIEIPINKRVSEIYFILGMTGERYQRYTFATKGNILGMYGKEVTMPLTVDDVEGFYVEIKYADGRVDRALPKNLSENRFSVSGDLSLYAVACDFTLVESVTLCDKKQSTDFPLLAMSVNEGEKRYFSSLLVPKYKTEEKIIPHTERYIKREGDRLKVRNGSFYAELDLSDTLRLILMKSDFAPSLSMESNSLIVLKNSSGEEICPRVINVEIRDFDASIILEKDGIVFTLNMDVIEDNNLVMSLNVNNNSQKPLKTSIFFPNIDKVNSKNDRDLYYFVPKYQNMISNETVVVCEESSPSFPMQFLSFYSDSERGGVGLLTRERDTVVRIYHLEKRDGVGSLSVEYPEMYVNIGAGERFTASQTVLEAESELMDVFYSYKGWLETWYEPYKCQNKSWYRRCFWLLAEITDFFETREIVRFPIWHERGENPKFNFLDILEEQKKLSGAYPDILHMWHWTVRYDEDGKKHVKWGNWGGEDYDIYGGLPRFRAALDEFQQKTGVYSSIYMHPTLFAESYPDFKKYEHLKVVNDEGKNIQLQDSFRMCHANADWRQYALDKYPRVYSELGVPILYVDEFSLRIENRCYADGHGHEIPSNLLKTDREFISRLKDTVPEELVLYGEYAAVDMNARYIDCNITYGILDSIAEMVERSWRAADSDEGLGRVMTDAYRFAFPKIVQLVLPMALRNLSWHPHKFIFWNGEAEYDSFWDLLESDGNEFTCKAYSIKKKYADAFASDYPEMLIKTLSPAICINKFPAENETVYTVYNRAYSTYRGEAVRIPHTEGNVYYDAWNERELDVRIEGDEAVISLEIFAQSIGCFVVTKS